MTKKKTKIIKIHPELKSALNTFFAGFIPVFVTQINTIDVNTMESGAIIGIIAVAVRYGVKYGLGSLIKWVVEKLSNVTFK